MDKSGEEEEGRRRIKAVDCFWGPKANVNGVAPTLTRRRMVRIR
jgi:hypothetical protein